MKLSRTYRFLLVPALAAALCAAGTTHDATARNKPCKRTKKANEQVLRQSRLLDLQKNTESNVELHTTNYGITGLNVDANMGGGYWPRGSGNMYLFGGGLWFGANKQVGDTFLKNVFITYNPNSGNSWAVPGRTADGDEIDPSLEAQQNNRVYFSTDYTAEGTPKAGTDGVNWPIWDTKPGQTPGVGGYAGQYLPDPTDRTMSLHPKGPVFLSDEDIFAIYKDNDLDYYEHGVSKAKQRGYPLGLDIAQTMYTWGEGELKDAVIIHYEIVNRSSDTLHYCWVAPVMDFDLAAAGMSQIGATNDRVRFYEEDPSLNLALQWTEENKGEAGKGFGYVGMSFLSSPAVDANRFLRRDKPFFDHNEQLGLKTFRDWIIENDPKDDGSRYEFMSAGVREGDYGPSDKRFLMATGPFNFLPGEKVRIAVALVFAAGAKGGPCDGTTEDLANLTALTRRVRDTYDASVASGVITRVGEENGAAHDIRIDRVFPNPASVRTSVEFTLPSAGETTVEIVDVTGRTVSSIRETLEAGPQVLTLDASAFGAGVYYCRVSCAGATATTMLSIVR